MMLPPSDGFTRTLANQSDGRMLIQSVCDQCGQSRIASRWDETLKEWEQTHACGLRIVPAWQTEETG